MNSSRNARSIASGSLGASSTAFATPRRNARSPPIRGCTFERARLRGAERRHLDEVVRDDRAAGRRLDDRVHVHDLRAALARLGQRGQHARRVRGGVRADHEDQVGLLPVVEVAGALAGAERRGQRAAARLVAHVRAVGQVVRAELAHPELVEEGRLVAEPARGVEGRLVRAREPAQRLADERERVVPRDRDVRVALGVVDERLGEAALVLEREVAPALELGDGVRGEERRRRPSCASSPR